MALVDGVIRASDCSTPHVRWSGGGLGGAETRLEVWLCGYLSVSGWGLGDMTFSVNLAAGW
jgi:hypothetical protein